MVVEELFLSRLSKEMEHQGITTILKQLSVVDITGPLIPHGLSDMCACASDEGKLMNDAFLHKPILHSILNYDHDTMTRILRAHGVKRMTLDAEREFGDSATFNGYSLQDNINVMESDKDFDDVHQLPYEGNDIDDRNVNDDTVVVNIGCNTLTRYHEKMRAAVAEFLSVTEGGVSVESTSKVMDDVLSMLRAASSYCATQGRKSYKKDKHTR